jgi:uncharacterized protein YjbJ (UPF0337 family)
VIGPSNSYRVCGGPHRGIPLMRRDGPGIEEDIMSDTGPEAAAKGVAEEVKGRAKEAVGAVTGNDSMKHEGEAQQRKADADRDVAEHEAKAEQARAASDAHEAEERSHQD